MHVLARTVVFRIRNEHLSIATPKILARRKARQSQCFILVPKESTQAAQESLVVLEDNTLAHGFHISQIAPISFLPATTSFRRGNLFRKLHIVGQEDLVKLCSVPRKVWRDRIVMFGDYIFLDIRR